MTDQPRGWFGTIDDAMRMDPDFWPTCQGNVFTSSRAEERPRCDKSAVRILTYEQGFQVVLCDEHLAERPTPSNRLLATERIEEWGKASL